MAANGFPGGEREGANQNASLDAIPEPLGDALMFFLFKLVKNPIVA